MKVMREIKTYYFYVEGQQLAITFARGFKVYLDYDMMPIRKYFNDISC